MDDAQVSDKVVSIRCRRSKFLRNTDWVAIACTDGEE